MKCNQIFSGHEKTDRDTLVDMLCSSKCIMRCTDHNDLFFLCLMQDVFRDRIALTYDHTTCIHINGTLLCINPVSHDHQVILFNKSGHKIFTGCCDRDLSFLKIAMLISCLHFSFYSGCNIPILGSRLCQHRIIVNIHIGFGDITFRDHTFQHPVSCDRKCMRIHLGHLFPCSTNGKISVNLFAFP